MNKISTKTLTPSHFQDMFDDFEKNAEMNDNATQDFRNIFADMNLTNSRLGTNTASRVKALSNIAEMIETIGLNDDHGRDVLGNVYEYLIAQFAADSGKKAGEFYTPHESLKSSPSWLPWMRLKKVSSPSTTQQWAPVPCF